MEKYRKPKFNSKTGYLVTGVYLMTISDLLNHPVLGGTEQRRNLICSLNKACECYWSYGIEEIYTNGSFATEKPIPNDIDGYLKVDVNSENFKNLVKNENVWGQFQAIKGEKLPMWHKHRIEFYIENKFAQFHSFFTHSRDGVERGIIKIIQGGQK